MKLPKQLMLSISLLLAFCTNAQELKLEVTDPYVLKTGTALYVAGQSINDNHFAIVYKLNPKLEILKSVEISIEAKCYSKLLKFSSPNDLRFYTTRVRDGLEVLLDSNLNVLQRNVTGNDIIVDTQFLGSTVGEQLTSRLIISSEGYPPFPNRTILGNSSLVFNDMYYSVEVIKDDLVYFVGLETSSSINKYEGQAYFLAYSMEKGEVKELTYKLPLNVSDIGRVDLIRGSNGNTLYCIVSPFVSGEKKDEPATKLIKIDLKEQAVIFSTEMRTEFPFLTGQFFEFSDNLLFLGVNGGKRVRENLAIIEFDRNSGQLLKSIEEPLVKLEPGFNHNLISNANKGDVFFFDVQRVGSKYVGFAEIGQMKTADNFDPLHELWLKDVITFASFEIGQDLSLTKLSDVRDQGKFPYSILESFIGSFQDGVVSADGKKGLWLVGSHNRMCKWHKELYGLLVWRDGKFTIKRINDWKLDAALKIKHDYFLVRNESSLYHIGFSKDKTIVTIQNIEE